MTSGVLDRDVAEAMDVVMAGLDGLSEAGLEPVDAADARVMVRELECWDAGCGPCR